MRASSAEPVSSRSGRPPLPNPSPARGEGLFVHAAGRLAGLAGALLGWRADEFWSATPAELAAVLRALVGDDAPAASRDDLARLMERFPDG
jgi:uncharacterized phage protein (TIGR02216 family)